MINPIVYQLILISMMQGEQKLTMIRRGHSLHPVTIITKESPMTAASNEVEETECNPNVDTPKSPQDENMKETLLEKSAYEFNNSPNEQNDGEAIEHETWKLSSNPISPSGDDEGECKNEKHHHKRYFPSGSRKIDMPHSVPHSPRSSHERSTSTLMEKPMLFSAAGSLQIHLSSNGHRPLSLHEGVSDQLHSPATCRLHLYSPERFELAKRISSHGLSSAPARQTSASPRKSRQGSRYKNSSSLKRKSSSPEPDCPPKKHQKHNRSMSRSHVRRRDSTSGYGRDYRGRSRSRSPYAGDHYRYPRRRYSPRQRLPPGYYPRHQSPRGRPWSPPPNRRTGVGKPGKNLFVAGFSFLTTERDLERKFSRFGQVRDVRIVRDKRSGDSRGFGFLSLERDEDADAAIRALDATEWNGRIILVEKSKSTR